MLEVAAVSGHQEVQSNSLGHLVEMLVLGLGVMLDQEAALQEKLWSTKKLLVNKCDWKHNFSTSYTLYK